MERARWTYTAAMVAPVAMVVAAGMASAVTLDRKGTAPSSPPALYQCATPTLIKACGVPGESKHSYKFIGSCQVDQNTDGIMDATVNVEVSGTWNATSKVALEAIEVVEKDSSVASTMTCATDPWITNVTCSLTAVNNSTPYIVLTSLNPAAYPFSRTFIDEAKATELSAGCGTTAPPPPPPPAKKDQKLQISMSAPLLAAVSLPKIASPTQNQLIPKDGSTVHVSIMKPVNSSPQSYQLGYQYFDKASQQWTDFTLDAQFTTVPGPTSEFYIPIWKLKVGKWRMQAKGMSPETGWTAWRDFEIVKGG